MHVAHRSHVINMLDGDALKAVIEQERPDYIVPEIEAIATAMLVELERQGHRVVPCAEATRLTMNREGIRRLAAEELACPPPAIALPTARRLSGRRSNTSAIRASSNR